MSVTKYLPLVRLEETNPLDNLAEEYDRRLVERLQAGDGEAFARLYDSYADRVLGYIYFHVEDKQTAEELSEWVFGTVRRNIHCYEPGNPAFPIWLYMIARQAVIEFSRRRREADSITEIMSPTDKGLAAYEPFRPCDNA